MLVRLSKKTLIIGCHIQLTNENIRLEDFTYYYTTLLLIYLNIHIMLTDSRSKIHSNKIDFKKGRSLSQTTRTVIMVMC